MATDCCFKNGSGLGEEILSAIVPRMEKLPAADVNFHPRNRASLGRKKIRVALNFLPLSTFISLGVESLPQPENQVAAPTQEAPTS